MQPWQRTPTPNRLTEDDLVALECATPVEIVPLALSLRNELVRVYREHYASLRPKASPPCWLAPKGE